MPNSRWPKAALAGVLSAAGVLLCFADVFFGPYLARNFRPNPSVGCVWALSAAAATLAMAIAVAWPRGQVALVRVLGVTAFIYLIFRPLAMPWSFWLSTFSLTPTQQYWAFRGPGGALFGLLPSAVAVLLGGRQLFGVSLREQWNGRLSLALRDLVYGGGAAVMLSAFFLVMAAATGNGRVAWKPNWAGHGANLVSNLYEELLARGLLLQVTRRIGGNRFGMLWTSLVFGCMHPLGWFAVGIALTTWILAWAILRAGSLWAGYMLHQGLDVFMDSLLH